MYKKTYCQKNYAKNLLNVDETAILNIYSQTEQDSPSNFILEFIISTFLNLSDNTVTCKVN